MNNTLKYFKEISAVPRPSGKEEKIKNYLINFAKEHNLEYFFDDTHNVIIKKNSNRDNCDKTLILQAHTDMVCEKNEDTVINFDTDPILLDEDEKNIFAKGTTLGADNGIGLSMILSILNDEKLNIPNLEAVFTTQEETTMNGALNLDFSLIKGEHLLSLDGTDEGKIEASCAGMVVAKLTKKHKTIKEKTTTLRLGIKGLKGGHSGLEINTKRLNSIKLLFKFLKTIKDVQLVSITGGGKSNAIARECFCIVKTCVPATEVRKNLKEFCKKFNKVEPEIFSEVKSLAKKCNNVLTKTDSKKLISFVNKHKNGVLIYSPEKKNFPLTSNNFANIKLVDGELTIIISLRSSVIRYEAEKLEELENLSKKYDLNFEITSRAPFFERRENSYLQKLCCETYGELYTTPAQLQDVHAGLEGGVFISKKPTLDICVIAANIYDAHSPKERVEKESINRTYKWLEKIVENF